jgi:hypothetical protein
MVVVYRTNLAAFALDQLDFIEGKLKEAHDHPASQKDAVIEAGGVIPQLRERLWLENPTKAAQCLLAIRDLFDGCAGDWWAKLADMDREQFLQEVRALLDPENGGIAAAKSIFRQ